MDSDENDDCLIDKASFESFFSTSYENSSGFLEGSYGSAREFLFRSEHIPIRSAYACEDFQDSNFKFDIDYDGFVVELRSIEGLLLPSEHLNLLPYDIGGIRPIYSMLRKHIDLTQYTASQLKQLRHSVGAQILYSHGWEVWVSFIPDETSSTPEYDRGTVQKCTYTKILELRKLFGDQLKSYMGTGLIRNSLMKTALTELKKVRLLPDERCTLFSLFQKALSKLDAFNGYKMIMFAFRFGERSSTPVGLEYFPPDTIRNISVHVGCTIQGKRGLQILWSRAGLQSVTGERGSLLTCLSFYEACNWQSNLDGRAMDIPNSLRRLCSKGRVRFIQFYADTPHRKYEGRQYPVTGIIVSAGLLPQPMLKALYADSERFINAATENCDMLQDLRCRLEIVSWFECVPESLNDILNVKALNQLIATQPLLVPFFDSDGTVIKRLRSVLKFNIDTLKELCDAKQCTGEFLSSWQAFQAEIALNKLIWGHQSSWLAKQYAVNTGPGIGVPSRSRTDQLGFLAFDEPTACTVTETSSPPLDLWIKNKVYHSRMKRLFGFNDFILSSNAVVGKRLILQLFGDLVEPFGEGKENLLLADCKRAQGKAVIRTLSVESLASMISEPRGGITCYRRAISLTQKAGRTNMTEILTAGILELSLLTFPAIQLYDKSRNEAFYWNGQNYFLIDNKAAKKEEQGSAVSITEKVIVELEKRRCIYMSKLKCFGDNFAFPWTENILRKLQGGGPGWKNLNERETIQVLCFLSAVALMQQGWFVPYETLFELERSSPLSQSTLRSLEIQSQYILFNRGFKNIWRIHPSIPIKLRTEEKKSTRTTFGVGARNLDLPAMRMENDDQPNEPLREIEDVIKVPIRHLPDNMYRRWTGAELSIIYEVKKNESLKSIHSKWLKYKELCNERSISDRSLKAFKLKYPKL